jgi:hypothetical protein
MVEQLVRPFAEGDEQAVNDGFNRAFGLGRTLDEWRWKFPAEPEGRYLMLTTDATGTVLAQYGAISVRFKAWDLRVRAGQIVDVYSAPEVRGGLATAKTFLRTADTFIETYCKPEALAVCYGFPSKRPLRLGVLRTGYAQMPPQPVSLWQRPSAARGRWLSGHKVVEGFVKPAIDELWARSRERYVMSGERDGQWLERRFTGRPGVAYLHLSAWRGGRCRAWAVLRLTVPVASWAELVWDGEDERALAALDRAAAAAACRAGAERLEMWLDGDQQAAAALARLSWVRQDHPLVHLVVHSFHPGIPPHEIPGRIYLTMADADLV